MSDAPLPDLGVLLAHARRCNAVYIADAAQAYAAYVQLGRKVIARYSSDTAQAVLSVAAGSPPDAVPDLDIAGTRVSNGSWLFAAEDVLEDAEEVVYNHDLGGGAQVASGAFSRATEIWTHVRDCVPKGCRVHGHSLGGGTTYAMLAVMPQSLFLDGSTSWEGIKAFNDAGWALYADSRKKVLPIINGLDPWAYHPWQSSMKWTPEPLLWLNGGKVQWTSRDTWPGPSSLHASDHDIEQVIIDLARAALAAK